MLPKQTENDGLTADFEEVVEPSKTFKLIHDKNRLVGFADEREALEQAIFLMLSIERYDHPIYSWNTGFESKDLIGKPVSYVTSEVKRRIRECLLQDGRITAVDSFETSAHKNKLSVKYTAHTIYGEITNERVVDY